MFYTGGGRAFEESLFCRLVKMIIKIDSPEVHNHRKCYHHLIIIFNFALCSIRGGRAFEESLFCRLVKMIIKIDSPEVHNHRKCYSYGNTIRLWRNKNLFSKFFNIDISLQA